MKYNEDSKKLPLVYEMTCIIQTTYKFHFAPEFGTQDEGRDESDDNDDEDARPHGDPHQL